MEDELEKSGDNRLPAEFQTALRRLADRQEALLIFDELQTGVGLTGKGGAHGGVDSDVNCE